MLDAGHLHETRVRPRLETGEPVRRPRVEAAEMPMEREHEPREPQAVVEARERGSRLDTRDAVIEPEPEPAHAAAEGRVDRSVRQALPLREPPAERPAPAH